MTAMESPGVSVAMIAFNKERELPEAIRGVVSQRVTFPIELIIVDDASTDSTREIALEWQRRYPDIVKVFSNPVNLGLQANYVEAFSHCSMKYMAICDADDYWFDRSKLRRMVRYMESHPECAVTFHRMVNLYEADGTMSLSNGGQRPECGIEELSRSNFITNSSVLYRRELVDTSALPSWILDDRSPDYAMHMFYAANGSIHYFSRPMGAYRISESGAWSMTDRYRRLEMSLTVRENLMRHFAGRPEVVDGLRQAAAGILTNMIVWASDDASRRSESRARLGSYPGFESEETIDKAVERIRAARPSLKKRFLRSVRRFVSRLLPRPRP